MMRHIRQLAEFKTGMEVKLGRPNEYLANETSEDLASPMYSTGIGLVLEGIAKYEKDFGKIKVETEKEQPTDNDKIETKEKEEKREKGESNISLKKIITGFTGFFKSENLDKNITE